ncbi:MAG: DUF3341 domain-containing protein [Bacteroidetes bacterium]|nr:DUF3341 domain-containing protein [Bacteroidota bacterium]
MIYGMYDDEEVMLKAVKTLRSNQVKINEVFTPFPVHGLDKALGLPRTRLATTAFIYGLLGLSLGLLMMWYMNISDWPINIGGKPNFSLAQNLPSLIPVAFEITVLFAAHLMVATFFFRSRLFPGSKASNPYPETTNDKFAIEFGQEVNRKLVFQILNETGAYKVTEKEISEN